MTWQTMKDDYERLPEVLDRVLRLTRDFHEELPERPVAASYDPAPPQSRLPNEGEGADAALLAFARDLAPHLSASVGPRYLGFVTGGVTPAALAGDWLVAAVDQNLGSPGDSIATRVSGEALGWLLDLFNLPRDRFTGVFSTGATASNFLALLTALEWAGEQAGVSPGDEGIHALPALPVFSATPHASFIKVMGISGLGRRAWRKVATLPGREAMDPQDLDRALGTAGEGPKMVVASAGTVTTTDFDDLPAVAEVCRARNAWLHVDGAFGMFARCVSDLAPLASGLELADSITGDAHKWLNVPYDCGFYFTHRVDLLERSCGVVAAYLDTGSAEPAFMNRGVENSQRFRALPVWLALKAYGYAGVEAMVQSCCRHARSLGAWIEESSDYELLAPVRLNVVAFRGLAFGSSDPDAFNRDLLARINATGKVFMTPGAFGGKSGIRAAFSNWSTQDEDLQIITAALREAAPR